LLVNNVVCIIVEAVNFIELIIDSRGCDLLTSFVLLLLRSAYLRRIMIV